MEGAFYILSSLLANCCSWVGMTGRALKNLEVLQNFHCQLVYACPDSTLLPLCGMGYANLATMTIAQKSILLSDFARGRGLVYTLACPCARPFHRPSHRPDHSCGEYCYHGM